MDTMVEAWVGPRSGRWRKPTRLGRSLSNALHDRLPIPVQHGFQLARDRTLLFLITL
ncbi:MAG: hypothetical protein AVDCRST_MAG93-8453 [uncultured Chloroflexia bacterium]|uniref:Uncharacterized protein n=1 Tax=uncultured Chloroflexia bacterium TaxID=1672391 RepID=A0A6J4N2P9_9CHLR|nr:MAG: hypothetical protein AVDCRST_MAG93-8453 [uncultured Chloroflexia bacterium]